jgi:Protein of unknown function (DUF3631)
VSTFAVEDNVIPFPQSRDALDLVASYLSRFVCYPNQHALVAHTLWIAHTWLLDEFDTTPRLAFMSQEPRSGKTRALEVSEHLVCEPLLGFSMSSAVVVRLVSERRRTVLFDEVDAVYGTAKRQEAHADLVAYMNAGYRRGAKSYRCSTGNGKVETLTFDAFAPLALAGLRDLPDALASRSIIIRMRRRSPDEEVESFRIKHHVPQAKPIKDGLEDWCQWAAGKLKEPELPAGVEDRAADCWEPLLSIADVYGGPWPADARAAAVHFTKANAEDEARSSGVELLAHIREAFSGEEQIPSKVLIDRLCTRDESPWATARRGNPIDEMGLARRLRGYGIKPRKLRLGAQTPRGYRAPDFLDAWRRYLPSNPEHPEHPEHVSHCNNLDVPPVPPVPGTGVKEGIPHPVYGDDPFNVVRESQPALKPKEERSE